MIETVEKVEQPIPVIDEPEPVIIEKPKKPEVKLEPKKVKTEADFAADLIREGVSED